MDQNNILIDSNKIIVDIRNIAFEIADNEKHNNIGFFFNLNNLLSQKQERAEELVNKAFRDCSAKDKTREKMINIEKGENGLSLTQSEFDDLISVFSILTKWRDEQRLLAETTMLKRESIA